MQLVQMRRRGARIRHPHPRPLPRAPERSSQARFAEAEDENVFAVPALHLPGSFINVQDSPNSTSRMVMIQKRTTTCVSFQPVCSK